MKLCILGATFDPVHRAHVQMAEYALDYCDFVLLTPSGNPPHKDNEQIASNQDRFAMLCLALEKYDKLIASDLEYKRDGIVYTIDSIREIKREYKQLEDLIYIIGADTLFQLYSWREYPEFFKLSTFLVFNRIGFSDDMVEEKIKQMEKEHYAKIIWDQRKVADISSTHIKKALVDEPEAARSMLDKKVYDYIKENGIYKQRR